MGIRTQVLAHPVLNGLGSVRHVGFVYILRTCQKKPTKERYRRKTPHTSRTRVGRTLWPPNQGGNKFPHFSGVCLTCVLCNHCSPKRFPPVFSFTRHHSKMSGGLSVSGEDCCQNTAEICPTRSCYATTHHNFNPQENSCGDFSPARNTSNVPDHDPTRKDTFSGRTAEVRGAVCPDSSRCVQN